jgi:hypothetical protein
MFHKNVRDISELRRCVFSLTHEKFYSRFHFDPELGSRGPNAAKNYLSHTPLWI